MEKREFLTVNKENLVAECEFLRRKVAEMKSENVSLKAENLLLKKLASGKTIYHTLPTAEFVAPIMD